MSSRMAADIFAELQGIQQLLSGSGPTARAPPFAAPPQRPAFRYDDTEDEDPSPLSPALVGAASQAAKVQRQAEELQVQVAALRQQQAEGQDKCQRLQDALAATQADGELVAQRLQAQLLAKQEEVGGGLAGVK